MTVLNADIRNALGQPLVGYIQIDLDYDLDNATTSFLSVPAKIPLVNGTATFSLEPSELARVSYVFSVWRTIAGSPDEMVREPFRAVVRDSPTPISFTDLVPTGITQNAMDGSLSAIARRLVSDDVFWARFQDELLQLRGTYNPTAWYQRGNMVFFNGGSYVFINRIAATGQPPTTGQANAYWMPTALPGQTVIGAIDPAALTAKADKTYVDSQNITLAPLNGAVLQNASVGDTVPLTQNDSRIAYTGWVQSLVTPVSNRTVPIGSILTYAGTSAPAGWIFCDGRVLVRSAFPGLFTILGTQYNIGGEAGTDFRVPDLRGRFPLGVDSYSTGTQGAANRVTGATHNTNGGSRTRTLTVGNLPPHSHQGLGVSNFYNQKTGAGTASLVIQAGNDLLSQSTTANTGNGDPLDILPPYLALNFIIHHGVV